MVDVRGYTPVQPLERFHRFPGDPFAATLPCQHDRELNLREITTPITERPVRIYRRDEQVGLLANLVMHRYRRDMSAYSPSEQDG